MGGYSTASKQEMVNSLLSQLLGVGYTMANLGGFSTAANQEVEISLLEDLVAAGLGGGGGGAIRSIATNGNLLVTDSTLLIDATAARAITLDTPATARVYDIIITVGSNIVTLTPASGNVNGDTSLPISGAVSKWRVVFDEVNWFVG